MIEFDLVFKANLNNNNVIIAEQVFNEPLLILAIQKNILISTNFEKLILKFEDCIFEKNVIFEIDLNVFIMLHLEIRFHNCVILGDDLPNIIKKPEHSTLNITYTNCILENITFDKIEITHLSVFNSVVKLNYFLIRDSEFKEIKFYNLLGNYGVHRSKNGTIRIEFGEENIKKYSNPILEMREEIGKNYKSIFSFPTSIQISEPQKLFVEFKKNTTTSSDTLKLLNNLKISLNVSLENEISEKIHIINTNLESVQIRNSSNASIEILRTKINRIFLFDISFKIFKIYDLSSINYPGSVFEVRNVDLSRATFDKADLSSYNIVSFYSSTLTDINFISPNFPKEIHVLKNIHIPDEKEDNYFRMQSENYRQLKKSLVASGNQVHALEMHSKMYKSLQKDKLLNREDKFILCLNGISNAHGSSIIRPFIIYIILSFGIFIIYRLSLDELPYKLCFTCGENIIQGFKYNMIYVFQDFKSFWILNNPTHKISTLEDLEPSRTLSSFTLAISYFSRLVMAWIIYQFIISFRKFGRKL